MKIMAVELDKRKVGWVCTVSQWIPTGGVPSETAHSAKGVSSWWPVALWRAWRAAREDYRLHAATPKQMEKMW